MARRPTPPAPERTAITASATSSSPATGQSFGARSRPSRSWRWRIRRAAGATPGAPSTPSSPGSSAMTSARPSAARPWVARHAATDVVCLCEGGVGHTRARTPGLSCRAAERACRALPRPQRCAAPVCRLYACLPPCLLARVLACILACLLRLLACLPAYQIGAGVPRRGRALHFSGWRNRRLRANTLARAVPSPERVCRPACVCVCF
mmetsp:Transcript_82408/g.255959  ORF Transcript_82408/g.255959 Transcript_82408/m.255959 type:complete len:208 (-) Transcript_82408:206-829(-)